MSQARQQQRAAQRAPKGQKVKAARRVQARQRQTNLPDISVVASTGGDFDPSVRSGPHSDTAARRTARRVGKPITVGKDNHYYVKVKRTALPDRHLPVDPFTGKVDRKYMDSPRSESGKLQQAAIQAPAQKVLEQTMRPTYGVMNAAKKSIQQEGVKGLVAVHAPGSKAAKERRQAFKRGAQLKDKTTGSDVLKAAGVKSKAVRAAGGFVLDVAADPTTYFTGGTGSVASKVAVKAARKAEMKAARQGLSRAQVKNFGRRAARQAERQAPRGRGVTVKLGGYEVPGVRRGTAKVARGVRKATRRVVGQRAATNIPAAARNVAREFAPRIAPAGVSREAHMVGRSQARAARATVSQGAEKATQLEQALRGRMRPEDHARVVDALERNNLSRIVGPTKKARDKLAKEDPKEFKRRQDLARLAHDVRSNLGGRRALRAGARPKLQPREFIREQDVKKLDRTIAAEQAAQRRGLVRAGRQETRAREPAVVAEAVGQVRHAGRVAVSREKQIAAARQDVVRAQKALRIELAKPVTQRRGVAALGANVQRARSAWEQARLPVTQHLQETPAVTGRRAGQAAERYERRAATTQQAQRQLEASQRTPRRSLNETPEAYLRRVRKHAVDNNLPLLRKRAEKMLAQKPASVARGYFPRETAERLTQAERRTYAQQITETPGRVGGTPSGRIVGRGTATHRRKDVRTIDQVNADRVSRGDPEFSKNVPLVVGNHLRKAARRTSQGEFAKNMADAVGRPMKAGEKAGVGEEVYHLGYQGGQYGLRRVEKGSVPAKPRAGQYVAMPAGLFDAMEKSTRGTMTSAQSPLLLTFDRVQGGWKRAAVTSLAFHLRNLIGDIQAGYYVPGAFGSLPKIRQATRAVARHSEISRQVRPPTSKATIKVAGKDETLDDFLKGAMDNGVLDTGIVAREVMGQGEQEVLKNEPRRLGRLRARTTKPAGETLNRWVTNRENVMRLAAYKAGLDRGMTKTEAADMANLFHIDYSELSWTEREIMRRLMPFYTWTARSLPVAGLTLVQRPGRFANLEKLREETAYGFTGQDQSEINQRMPASVQRNLPVVIRVGGTDYGVSASIPATLLNEFPSQANKDGLTNWIDEIAHFGFGMATPVLKAPTEKYLNQSFFTRRPIEDPRRPLVPAPAWIAKAPDFVKRMVGAARIVDKDTGRKIWGWRGTADWVSRQVPGAAQQVSQAAAGGRPGQEALGFGATAASQATGVRLDKLGKKAATSAQKSKLRTELARLDERAALLNQQGINRDNPTAEYKRLRKRINEISKVLHPRKRKGRSGLDLGINSSGQSGPDLGMRGNTGGELNLGLGQ